MSLYQKPPESIVVSDVEYPVETDFRAWVRFQGILLSDGTNDDKAAKICDLMVEMGLPQTKESLDAMLQFYAGASTENSTGGGKECTGVRL